MRAATLGLAGGLFFCAAAFGQGNLGFLKDAPAAQFSPKDWELLRAAARSVLNDTQDKASQTWSNPESGNHGEIRVTSTWQAEDGRQCKMMQVRNYANDRQGSSRYPVCRTEGGEWRLDETTAP